MKRIENGQLVYDTIEDLRKDFEENKMIKKLLDKKKEYSFRGNIAMVFEIDAQVEKAWKEVLKNFQRKAVSFKEAVMEMEPDDAREAYLDLYSLMLMADCFDFINAEMEELFSKYGSTPVLEAFSGIRKAARLGKAEISEVLGRADLGAQESLAIYSDELRELIKGNVKKGFLQDMLMRMRTSGINI